MVGLPMEGSSPSACPKNNMPDESNHRTLRIPKDLDARIDRFKERMEARATVEVSRTLLLLRLLKHGLDWCEKQMDREERKRT